MKKRYLVIAVILFAFVLAGLFVFFRIRGQYVRTGLAPFDSREGAYDWNGKLLLSQDGQTAVAYRPMERLKLEEIPRTEVDLTPYGFDGQTFSYFPYNGYALCMEEGYEGFWPVSTPERFLYRDGETVWQVDTRQGRAWHVFADSVPEAPEDGKGLRAFSSDGSYALSLSGDGLVSIYHTDPENDSLRIVDVKTVALSDLGDDAAFVAFTGERYAAFTLKVGKSVVYAAVDCAAGEAVLCPTDYTVLQGDRLSRFFSQRALTEEEQTEYCAAWTNLLLGTDTLSPGQEADLQLIAVSPEGKHAAARRGERVWILSEERLFCLTDILEGEWVSSVDFLEENVIAVSVLRDDKPMLYSFTVLF